MALAAVVASFKGIAVPNLMAWQLKQWFLDVLASVSNTSSQARQVEICPFETEYVKGQVSCWMCKAEEKALTDSVRVSQVGQYQVPDAPKNLGLLMGH